MPTKQGEKRVTLRIPKEEIENYELVKSYCKKMGISINHLIITMINETANNFKELGLEGEPSMNNLTVKQLAEFMNKMFQ